MADPIDAVFIKKPGKPVQGSPSATFTYDYGSNNDRKAQALDALNKRDVQLEPEDLVIIVEYETDMTEGGCPTVWLHRVMVPPRRVELLSEETSS